MLVAVVSAIAAMLIGRIGSALARWFAAVLFPLALSYCLYWMPVWLGADASEYPAWALLGVGIPFVAGCIPSVLVTFVTARHAKRQA